MTAKSPEAHIACCFAFIEVKSTGMIAGLHDTTFVIRISSRLSSGVSRTWATVQPYRPVRAVNVARIRARW
jgi:hypothetical protein